MMSVPASRFDDRPEPRRPVRHLRVARPADPGLPPWQRRTCSHCGARTWFRLEDLGGWYSCSECRAYA